MTPERQERVLKLQEKRVAHDHLMLELQNAGPEERREIIGQILGIKLKPREEKSVEDKIFEEALQNDPEYREAVKQAKLEAMRGDVGRDLSAEVDAKITEAAISRLESDPQLLGRAVEKRIDRLVSGGRHQTGQVGDLLELVEAGDALRERFGGDKGKDGGILDKLPALIDSASKLLPFIVGSRQGGGERVYVVNLPDGSLQEMNAESYKAFLETEQRGKLPQPTVPPAVQVLDVPPFKPPAPSLKLSLWLPYLEKDPSEFVEALRQQAQGEGEEADRARFTLSLLQTNTAESLMAMVLPFKERGGDIQKAIEGLEANLGWLESVVNLVKAGENVTGL